MATRADLSWRPSLMGAEPERMRWSEPSPAARAERWASSWAPDRVTQNGFKLCSRRPAAETVRPEGDRAGGAVPLGTRGLMMRGGGYFTAALKTGR